MKRAGGGIEINDELVAAELALMGIGDLEKGIVKKIKENLEKLLDKLYTQIKTHRLMFC